MNCCKKCFDFNQDLPEYCSSFTTFRLITVPLFYMEDGCSNDQQIWLVDSTSNFFDLLPQLKDGEWLNCSPRCFESNHNLPEFLNSATISTNCSSVSHFTAPLFYPQKCCSTKQLVDRSSSKKWAISPDPSF